MKEHVVLPHILHKKSNTFSTNALCSLWKQRYTIQNNETSKSDSLYVHAK